MITIFSKTWTAKTWWIKRNMPKYSLLSKTTASESQRNNRKNFSTTIRNSTNIPKWTTKVQDWVWASARKSSSRWAGNVLLRASSELARNSSSPWRQRSLIRFNLVVSHVRKRTLIISRTFIPILGNWVTTTKTLSWTTSTRISSPTKRRGMRSLWLLSSGW